MDRASNASGKKILIAVGSGSSSERLIRSACEAAGHSGAELHAVHVAAGKRLLWPEGDDERAAESLMVAERAGAKTVMMKGRDIADEIIGLARQRGITDIFIGKPRRSNWACLIPRNPVHSLLRAGTEFDVHVIPEEAGDSTPLATPGLPLADYGSGLLFWILATVLCFAMFPFFDLSNLIMVYLLAVLMTATGCGRGPAILNSFLCVLSFDFFFVPPRYSFTVNDAQYIVTFAVMFVIALAISNLAARLRREAVTARLQERQANAMHGLSRQLAAVRGVESILKAAEQYLSEIFHSRVIALLPDEKGKLAVIAGDPASVIQKDMVREIQLAQSVYSSGRMAGWGTSHSSDVEILCMPLKLSHGSLGVLALRPENVRRTLTNQQLNLLESLSKQVALSLEVEYLSKKCLSPSPS